MSNFLILGHLVGAPYNQALDFQQCSPVSLHVDCGCSLVWIYSSAFGCHLSRFLRVLLGDQTKVELSLEAGSWKLGLVFGVQGSEVITYCIPCCIPSWEALRVPLRACYGMTSSLPPTKDSTGHAQLD